MDERDAHPPRDPPRSSRHRARTAEEFHAFDNTAFESTRAPPTKILNVILPRREPSRRDSGPSPLLRVSVPRVSVARTERPNRNPSIDRSARAHTARVASSSTSSRAANGRRRARRRLRARSKSKANPYFIRLKVVFTTKKISTRDRHHVSIL